MVWLRGYASNAAGDSVYVGLNGQVVSLTGLAPNAWGWARTTTNGVTATLPITTTGLQTISVWMREDGFRLDRLLLTTDTTYVPTGFGPTETPRLLANRLVVPLDRTIVYTYDNLYRLTEADYSTGELYEYDYDPAGNRLEQIINGDTTTYIYDDANRLDEVTHQSTVTSYQFDDNGNLLKTGVLTNAFDAANRLTSTVRAETTPVLPKYNGVGDRVAQTVGSTTVYYALDVVGLPEVIQTSEGNSYLHLPGVIMAESAEGEVRYLLSDGLGSIRQAVDETGDIVSYSEFDPYGNPILDPPSSIFDPPYGYTGEWWEQDVGLLHLRARWYLAETGTFLSRDLWSGSIYRPNSLHGYIYAGNNPIRFKDPTGLDYIPELDRYTCDDPRVQNGYGPNGKRCVVPPDTRPGRTPGYNPCSPVDPEDTSWQNRPECQKNAPVPAPTNTNPQAPRYQAGQGADGYAEGHSIVLNAGLQVVSVKGRETVWDFATLERMTFHVTGHLYTHEVLGQRFGPTGICTTLIGGSISPYTGYIWGFSTPPTGNLEDEYKGTFAVGQGGFSLTPFIPFVGVSVGVAGFSSVYEGTTIPNGKIRGVAMYGEVSGGIGLEELWIAGGAILATYYIPINDSYVKFSSPEEMAQDLRDSWNPFRLYGANLLLQHYPE